MSEFVGRKTGAGYEPFEAEVFSLAEAGVVYTKPWAVGLVLDLAGYDSASNLVDAVAVEPSCGDGEFLEAMVRRLSLSCRRQGRSLSDCGSSLFAFDLSAEAVRKSRARVESVLAGCGWDGKESRSMAQGWVRRADFLLDAELDVASLGGGVDFVVGNPPYVRLEFADQADVSIENRRFRQKGSNRLY